MSDVPMMHPAVHARVQLHSAQIARLDAAEQLLASYHATAKSTADEAAMAAVEDALDRIVALRAGHRAATTQARRVQFHVISGGVS